MGILEDLLDSEKEDERLKDEAFKQTLGRLTTDTAEDLRIAKQGFGGLSGAGLTQLARQTGGDLNAFFGAAEAARSAGLQALENETRGEFIAKERRLNDARLEEKAASLRKRDRIRAFQLEGVSNLVDDYDAIPRDPSLRTKIVESAGPAVLDAEGRRIRSFDQAPLTFSPEEERGIRAFEIANARGVPKDAVLQRLEEERNNPEVIGNEASRKTFLDKEATRFQRDARTAAAVAANPALRSQAISRGLDPRVIATAEEMKQRADAKLIATSEEKQRKDIRKASEEVMDDMFKESGFSSFDEWVDSVPGGMKAISNSIAGVLEQQHTIKQGTLEVMGVTRKQIAQAKKDRLAAQALEEDGSTAVDALGVTGAEAPVSDLASGLLLQSVAGGVAADPGAARPRSGEPRRSAQRGRGTSLGEIAGGIGRGISTAGGAISEGIEALSAGGRGGGGRRVKPTGARPLPTAGPTRTQGNVSLGDILSGRAPEGATLSPQVRARIGQILERRDLDPGTRQRLMQALDTQGGGGPDFFDIGAFLSGQ